MAEAGRTMAEKILARTSGRAAVGAGDTVTCRADLVMAHEAFTVCALKLVGLGIDRVFDPEKILVILDHYFPCPDEKMARGHSMARDLVRRFGIAHFLGHAGVCHQVLIEGGHVLPGQLVFGTDSHSTTYGAVGAAGNGIGLTEMTYVLATGEIWLQVPPTIRFVLQGELGGGLMSKDVILHLAGRFGTEVAQYRAIEFAGPAARRMTVGSRMTMSNMGVELGAKFAFFEADDVTCDYLRERVPSQEVAPFGPDAGAVYEASHEVDLSPLEPQIARPHNPGNVVAVSEVEGVRVDQAFLGSCTNGRLEDLAVAAGILRGRKVAEGTRLLVTPASRQVYLEATRAGYSETLLAAGAHITAPGCGACPGGLGGVMGPGETCISSTNRNFRGRMGSAEADVYLGSPASVVAAAVAGEIVDPRNFWNEPSAKP
jgi:3-isopropylmalate/(R)-2-methylmalate dehydratase large subunit